MLDIKRIKDNREEIKVSMRSRNLDIDTVIDELIEKDRNRKDVLYKLENLKAQQNRMNKEISAIKKSGGDMSHLMSQMKGISDQVSEYNKEVSKLDQQLKNILLSIPNVPHSSVPVGKDETQNKEIRRVGTPKEFSFEPKPHWDLGKDLGILDAERAAKITGTRFNFYKGLGAKLERAIINFYLDTHTQNGYNEIFPPFIVNRESMTGTGQLPKFEEDAFKVWGTDYFLIPTAEVPVTNMYRDEILDGSKLPYKYCAYSACFRAEVGSAGRDTRGIIRQHQFNKVELVKFSRPEDSYNELESLTNDAEEVLKKLGLPYRVVALSSGDLGFSSAKTYDIEVWMPSYNRYLEISSCSNFEDYQSRRMAIRFKDSVSDKSKLVHTLNGSGVAVGRTVAAILENFQNEDGTIIVPEVLIKYMGTNQIGKKK